MFPTCKAEPNLASRKRQETFLSLFLPPCIGAWPVCLLGQAQGARRAGAGGGPWKEKDSLLAAARFPVTRGYTEQSAAQSHTQ